MNLTCLGIQVNIVCGDGNQALYTPIQKAHTTQRTDVIRNTYPEPLNGLVNAVARFEAARLNKGQPVLERACMEYIDNNACAIVECPH